MCQQGSVEVTGQQSNLSVKARLNRLHEWITHSEQVVRALKGITDRPPGASSLRRRQHRISPKQVHELIAAYKMGVPINELARQFVIHRSTVLDHVNRAGTKRRYPALGRLEVEEASQLYRAGKSLREVGKHFGVHASTVGQYLVRAGIKLRDCQGRGR